MTYKKKKTCILHTNLGSTDKIFISEKIWVPCLSKSFSCLGWSTERINTEALRWGTYQGCLASLDLAKHLLECIFVTFSLVSSVFKSVDIPTIACIYPTHFHFKIPYTVLKVTVVLSKLILTFYELLLHYFAI